MVMFGLKIPVTAMDNPGIGRDSWIETSAINRPFIGVSQLS
jgi:hypothetical protein